MKILGMIKSMQNMMTALMQSLRDITKVLFIMLLIWILFSNIGIILYQNKFGYCAEVIEFNVNHEECEHEPNKHWITYKLNFENGFESMITLFTISTLDLWGELYQVAQNS